MNMNTNIDGATAMAGLAIVLALLIPTVALAEQRQTFRDANGREVGRATTDARGNTVYRDNMARTTGRSVTSGGTTIIYDQMGRQVGTFHRGGLRLHGKELLAFAQDHCGIDRDLERAEAVLADMKALTGFDFFPHKFVDGASAMLFEHWSAVSALASELVDHRRIEGADVERIIGRSLWRISNMRRTC